MRGCKGQAALSQGHFLGMTGGTSLSRKLWLRVSPSPRKCCHVVTRDAGTSTGRKAEGSRRWGRSGPLQLPSKSHLCLSKADHPPCQPPHSSGKSWGD